MFIIFLSPPLLAQYQSFAVWEKIKRLSLSQVSPFIQQKTSTAKPILSLLYGFIFAFRPQQTQNLPSQTQAKRVFLDGKFLRDGEPAERSAPEKLALRTWAPTALPQLEI
jgi:hypothetical protein